MQQYNTLTVSVLGHVVDIAYSKYSVVCISWWLIESGENPYSQVGILLDALLRTHYSMYIENRIKEEIHRKEYAKEQIADAQTPNLFDE